MIARPHRLVMFGGVLVDVLLYVDHLPERGADVLASGAMVTTGGGFNLLVASVRLGLPAVYAGRVGTGPFGTQVMTDLVNANIPLLLPRVASEDSGFDIGLVETDAERTFVTSPGVESQLTLEDVISVGLLPGDAVYVSGYTLCYPVAGTALSAWLPTLGYEQLLVLDPGPLVDHIPIDRLGPVLARTDILSLNAREAALLTGADDEKRASGILAERVSSRGWVIVWVSDQGCWVSSRNESPTHVPVRPTIAIDTTGAGDSHVAALLARPATGLDMVSAAREANIAAALSVEHRGPATGPTIDELEKALCE